jgi:hypothetical protein
LAGAGDESELVGQLHGSLCGRRRKAEGRKQKADSRLLRM